MEDLFKEKDFKMTNFLTQEEIEGFVNRRIQKQDLQTTIDEFKNKQDILFILCGSKQMVRDINSFLLELGIEQVRVFPYGVPDLF